MLVISATLLAAALFTYVYGHVAPVQAGLTATVSVNGKVVDTIYLDQIKPAAPFWGVYEGPAGFNTVYADSDGAAVAESDCPDQYCVRTGRISTQGASSVCLPHRFILRISGRDNSGLDGGTY